MGRPRKTVSTEPEVIIESVTVETQKEELVTIVIDRDITDGGLRTNGKLQAGNIRVTKGEAEDLLRRQEEYGETKKKLLDPNISVRMKNDFQKERLFLADPKYNEGKRGFSRDYGLLGAREWSFCTDTFKEHLLDTRKQMFGY